MPIERRTSPSHAAWLLFICAVSALGGFLFGLDAVVISGAIAAVKTQFSLTSSQEGLFVSASLIGCAIGAALAGASADRFGRKRNLVAAALITLTGVILCTFANSAVSLILSRWIGGLGIGFASMTCPLYIAEIAPAAKRGRLVALYQFAITLGIVVALTCNALIAGPVAKAAALSAWPTVHADTWRLMFAVQIPAALFFALLCLSIPESPRWLLMMEKRERALKILRSLQSQSEINQLIACFDSDQKAGAWSGRVRLYDVRFRRAAIITILLSVFSELSGVTVIFYYGPLILQAAGMNDSGALSGFAVLGFVNAAATIIALVLLDRAGRRKLLLIGSIGCAICMAILASTLQSKNHAGALMVGAICTFVAFYAFSLGPIKFVMATELFPKQLRGSGTSLGTTTVWVTGAVINQLFPIVRDSLGPAVVFYFCAGSIIVHFVFVRLFVPETSGIALEDLESIWELSPGVSDTKGIAA